MTPALSRDAAMVLGLAGTAMPFARTREEEAERWLRVLRLHGDVAGVLQSVGIGESPLQRSHKPVNSPGLAREPRDSDAVEQVTGQAARIAAERGAATVASADVLLAVMQVYGDSFDRVLRSYGTDRNEVLERLDRTPAAPHHD
jgi:ATP-dependent Clp protease ATP-binding subunit ClpA